MINDLFKLEYLSPTGYIGFWVMFIGLIFTGIMFYFVFFKLNDNNESFEDKKRKELNKECQKREIARLYPKKNKY